MAMSHPEPDEELYLYKEEKTGLLITGVGPFLFPDTVGDTFKPGVTMIAGETKVNKDLCVMYMECDQEHRLYVEREEDVQALFELVNPDLEPIILISLDHFKGYMKRKHKETMTKWAHSSFVGVPL
jgi:hypothetical protein